MNMITREEADARVARGAAHLDRVLPGWPTRIDLSTLALDDPYRCVITQVSGCLSFEVGADVLGLTEVSIIECGFDRLRWYDTGTDPTPRRQYFAPLQDAWVEAIVARLAQMEPRQAVVQ